MNIRISLKPTLQIGKTPILQQSSYWSEVKRRLGFGSRAFDIRIRASELYCSSNRNNIIEDDILLLFQEIGDGYSIGYVPYGPTLKPDEENFGIFLEELTESLRPFLPKKCILLRYDLMWESPWARDEAYYDENNEWIGPPASKNQEILLNFDTQNRNLRKAITNILPSDTIFIDLRKKEDQLLLDMKPKTRYNVKLSERKGVRVKRVSLSELDIWYKLYKETCKRNHIFLQDIRYFKTVLSTKVEETRSPAEVELLVAEFDKKPLAAMFLACSAQRASYLYGASATSSRNMMPTYALQWEAIKRAKRKGCTEYDMFGVAPRHDPDHPLYGLYRFKKGFGGKMLHRMGCWDYPLIPKLYDIYLTTEMTSTGYHLN